MPGSILFKNISWAAGRIAALLILATFPLAAPTAQAAIDAAPPNLVYLYPTPVTKLCVGQQVRLTGWYKTNPAPQTRLIQGPGAFPAPTLALDSTATIGQISPKNQSIAGDTAGNFVLSYTATQAGDAVITSTIAGSSAAQVRLRVYQACSYHYAFYAEVHNSFTFDAVTIGETYRFSASGLLAPAGPKDLTHLRDDAALLGYNGQIDSFELPTQAGVTIDEESYTPAQGSAAAAAQGVFAPDGSALHFSMTKSRLKATSALILKITTQSITSDAPFSEDLENAVFSYFNQPASQPDFHFVDITVAPTGGSYQVSAPELGQVCDFLNQSPGFKCSYTARVDLEIVGQ